MGDTRRGWSLIGLVVFCYVGYVWANDSMEPQIPQYLKNKYGSQLGSSSYSGGVKTSYSNTKTSYGGGSNPYAQPSPYANSYSSSKTHYGASPYGASKTHYGGTSGGYKGGCSSQPPAPLNAGMRCSSYSGCKANCLPDYQFPNGQSEIQIMCENGEWRVPGTDWTIVPSCQPACLPECQNNGICIAPNQCNCPENFSGPQCQFENKPCLNFPPMPMNAKRMCRTNQCTISCMPGYVFPDGSAIANMICKGGLWVPAKVNWVAIPDCQATCQPACQNGGVCLSFNVCQCPQDYRGPQCQYRSDVCSAKNLAFNGGYNCSGDMESFSCAINCPEGIPFEFQPEPLYTCRYSTGIFIPSPIPQCLYPENVQIIEHTGSGLRSHSSTNYSVHSEGSHRGKSVPNYNYIHPMTDNNIDIPPSVNFIPIPPDEIVDPIIPVVPIEILPKPGVCFSWGGKHFKTFDGKIYSFNSQCTHVLLRDALDNTFSIAVQNAPTCITTLDNCYKIIRIYFQDKEYILKKSEEGFPIFASTKRVLPIPGQVPGIRVENIAHFIIVSIDALDVKLRWDGQQLVYVEVKESLWNRTEGLCGRIDGNIDNDFVTKEGIVPVSVTTLASSWKVDDLENYCFDVPTEEYVTPDDGIEGSPGHQAMIFCKKLLSNPKFKACSAVVDTYTLLDACRSDYTTCTKLDPSECACETLNVYVRDCISKGIQDLANWRDDSTCPMKCTGGKIYKPCGSSQTQASCGVLTEIVDTLNCEEGCYCPQGTVLHENKCITKDQCPCKLRGLSFAPGSSVPKDCNTCTCSEGQWICTQVSCGARCAAVGDPHYSTFDGKRYDFMGQCSYYLVKTDSFSIEAENVACAGAISEAMNFPISISSGLPSCTKTVTIKIDGHVIKLKQKFDLVINGQDITKLPYKIGGIDIRSVSSLFLQVELPNGVQVWWDGLTRVYIDLPASFKDKTKGLCGTFNNNQKDDFLTPDGDVEQSVIPFANKWKTSEKCNDIPEVVSTHPCDLNVHNKVTAEKHCSKIKSNLFKDCHIFVDPDQYYNDCLYDMCACEYTVSKCLCPTVSAYATECSRKGIKIDWRNDIRECGVHCPGGQKYQICGNACTRTCSDISVHPDCKIQCIEGCNCPEGQALDNNGECIPIGQCKCQHEGLEFPAGYKEVRPAPKGPELCTCTNAVWKCKPASKNDEKKYPRVSDQKLRCDASKNFEFSTCENVEPVTCKNMHRNDHYSPAVCHSGCNCKEGYVLDSKNKRCVKPVDCPCQHGGRSYKEKSVVQSDCNTCTCKNGKWVCTDRQCTAECSAWGDSHFKTFDGKHYDYQGQCDYLLAKGSIDLNTFEIIIQNVPCGSLGTSCSKSITIRLNIGEDQETIVLTKDKPIPKHVTKKHLTIREASLFVIVEAPDLGLAVHWDQGTRVYVKLDPRWKAKVKGLCGNYNNDESDDFETPSGGLAEVSAQIFGDSWKLQSYCPEASEIINTCIERPERKVFALKKCGIIKSQTFAACHTEVPYETYFDKCVFDTCACDQGGDCECLCTAISAYAQECNSRGVPIKWRSQHLCPIECDEGCSKYSPCISTCPLETCDNLLSVSKLSKSCKEDACVEGCSPKRCPPDHVYLNTSYTECVPRNSCRPLCLEEDGVSYYEGDIIEEDDCHTCTCSLNEKICKGQPCSTTPTIELTTNQSEEAVGCKPGWTDWLNQDNMSKDKKLFDFEPLPSDIVLNNLKHSSRCNREQMIDIECRTVKTHTPSKETGSDVECSLENGLICKANSKGELCPDFEIRVLCQCDSPPATEIFPLVLTTERTVGECNFTTPNKEHPTDCYKFFECQPNTSGGYSLVEKTCGPTMMYNPQTMTCDWPESVMRVRNYCAVETVTIPPEVPQNDCPIGQVKDDCAIECDKLCLYYSFIIKEKGLCMDGVKCESGCVSAHKKMRCPPNQFWADDTTCVDVHDCLCQSHDRKAVKPGQTVQEDECQQCQCINNFYTCHDNCNFIEEIEPQINKTEINKQEQVAFVEEKDHKGLEIARNATAPTLPPIIIPTSITPPPECEPDRFIHLIQGDQPLPDSAFNASSILSPSFAPNHAKLDSKITEISGGSWAPQFTNTEQYLEVNLGRQEPIYGVIVRGSPLYDEYVTSYQVLYSPDGHIFYYILNDESPPRPRIFRGSVDSTTPIKQIFEEPIEAKIVRINPQTWNNGISLRVELIGCSEEITTVRTTPMYNVISTSEGFKPQFCDDEMGLNDGSLVDQQITTSSEKDHSHGKSNIRLNSDSYWQPFSNSPNEWVEFNFLEPRTLTGIVTKGGDNGWVSAYVVKYSHNGKEWSTIIDNNHEDKVFLGNFDSNSPQVNNFALPISAVHLKISPIKWNKNIQLRVEIRGCYEKYKEITEPVVTTTVKSACNNCPGVETAALELNACRCASSLWWDGENCVNRTLCPCMVGHMPYGVGKVFQKEDCSECICELGGIARCSPKKCDKCKDGLKSTLSSTCVCTCQPCPDGTTLCPTSDICINSTLWCNGVQDCNDDEIDCTTKLETTTQKLTTTTKKPHTCPIVECQIGYRKVEKTSSKQQYISPMISEQKISKKKAYQTYAGIKTSIKNKSSNYKPFYLSKPQNNEVIEEPICKEYACVSSKPSPVYIHSTDECPAVLCQANYIPVFDTKETNDNKVCPSYSCYPPPEPDVVCNVTGRTFNTFDNTEYKYDICNHLLGRDLENDEWDVSLKKNCTTYCSRDLIIRHNDDIFIMYPDLSISYNGYKYTVAQAKNINNPNKDFTLSQLGNTLLFLSNKYGFWVIWNTLGDVKFGVVHKLAEKVDGLCGYFNDNPADDKRKPDGTLAKTTVEFGDSWALSKDQPSICEAKACPLHIQNKAWEMCNKVKEQPLSDCARVIDIETFISRCLETTCNCLEHNQGNHTAEEECKCNALQSFVVDCLSADSTIDLSDWRMQQDCPVTCESPLVYHDCFQRKCEPTCDSISDPNVCPKISSICFPGCYCPAGYVRKDETCIKPSECRDCECNVLPHLQYVTYDESNFTVSGNCVYVMSRDIEDENEEHKFQVLVTNHPCKDKPNKMCVGKITILYQGQKIHILVDYNRNKLKLIVDNERIDDFEELLPWATVRETATKHMKLLLVEDQVEVSVYYPSLGMSVKAPSHKYKGKLEGLCGDCNGNSEDDIKKPDGKKPQDIDDFALSWLYEHLPGGQSREECHNEPEEKCEEIATESDPCLQLLDVNKFGQCLNVLNPSLFIEWCKKDTCNGKPEQACSAIEAYARDCASNGFCINWRNEICPPKSCPSDQTYEPCGILDPDTCENIKEVDRRKLRVPVESCYCPEGKVLLNNTCVEPRNCEVCDTEGHHPGDKWKKDKCTTCQCEGTSLKCETEHCTSYETVCQRGYTPMKVPSKNEECCDKYICVPEATVGPTCETPQKLQCGPGQIMKLDTKPNGCQTFICECKPPEDCESLDLTTESPLEPGYIKEIDDSGCCPVANLICKEELCPEAKECPIYHTLKTENIPNKCCPLHTCEPPKDKCIFEKQYTAASPGGERLLTKYEKQKELKKANETWNDGPCRECKCELTSIGNYQPLCSQTKCEKLENHEDYKDFILEEVQVFEQCCPKIKRTACKYEGKVYKTGEKWTKGTDYCTSLECIETENGIQRETTVKTCNKDCDIGYEYFEPKPESKECCGSCKPVACVVEGKVYKSGEEWTSKDHCTNYFCLNLEGSYQVQAVKVSCPEISEESYNDFVIESYPIEGKCCKEFKQTACKVGKTIYKVGDTWPDPEDKCKKITCVKGKNEELSKQESIETCKKDCKQGWEYKESDTSCCGECIQTSCIVGDEIKKLGETWSSLDSCTNYTCDNISNNLVVSSQQESCPSLDECPEENIVVKGCCKHCNITHESQKMCVPEPMALNDTIGLIKENKIKHGKCINKEPIPNFTECIGSCHSSTMFNIKSGLHESVCSCCQATKYKSLEVTLECEDGKKWEKKVAVPIKCDCTGCASESKQSAKSMPPV